MGLSLAFAVLFAAAFPFRAGELRFDVGLVAGWIALVPLALLVRDLTPRAAFGWGTLAGTVGFAGVLFWIYVVVAVHGGAPPLIAVFIVVLMAAANGLHVGAVTALSAALEPRAGRVAFLVLPMAWVAVEHFRGAIPFGGFPWAFLGYSAHTNGPIRELASLGGVYLLSALMAVFASLLARRFAGPAVALLVLVHLLGFVLGVARLRAVIVEPDVRVAVVQGNIPQSLKWDPEFANEAFRAHIETTRLAAAGGPVDLIVWPEASATVPLAQGRYRDALRDLAVETGATLLVGGVGYESTVPQPSSPDDYRFFNSVYVVEPTGEFSQRYDKSKLVPFGEYLPLRPLLGWFVGAVASSAAGLADMTPGPGPEVLASLPGLGPAYAPTPLICYEVIYPSLVRRAVEDGARVLVNVTNDAWYGRTSGPDQFVAIAALRSAEHGLPMIRAANTGVSAIVGAGGEVLERTPIFERRALVARLPSARSGPTPYSLLGDWVAWSSWAGLLGIGGASLVGRRRHSGGSGRSQGSA